MIGHSHEKMNSEFWIGNPVEFYNEKNRINHFINFCKTEDNEESIDDEFVN